MSSRWRLSAFRRKERDGSMLMVGEDPRRPQGGAADHDAIAARLGHKLDAVIIVVDIAVADHRDGDGFFYLGDH